MGKRKMIAALLAAALWGAATVSLYAAGGMERNEPESGGQPMLLAESESSSVKMASGVSQGVMEKMVSGIFQNAIGKVASNLSENVMGKVVSDLSENAIGKVASNFSENALEPGEPVSGQEGSDYGMEETLPLLSVEEWEKMPVGEYPINIQSPEWEEMSYTEARAACNMPKEMAESLTTGELARYAVNYPHLGVVLFVFDSINDGLDSLRYKSNVFSELYARSDCNQRLLEEYLNLSCDYRLLEEEYDMIGSNYEKKMYLEAYFGQNYESLTEKEKDAFMEEFERKYGEQPESIREYSTAKVFYAAKGESMPLIPEGWGADPSHPFAGMWQGIR